MSAIRLLALLLVCLAMASAVVHKIQTQHHALPGKHTKHLFGQASLRHQQLYRRKVGRQASVGKLPYEQVDYLIVGNITIGTPPQSFIVEVDAFYDNELLVIDANANMSYVQPNLPKKSTYNSNISSTFVAVNGSISTWLIKGHKAQDVLNIGSLSATIEAFAVADKVSNILNYYPIDGILGLSPIKKSRYNVSVVADDLIDQLDKPVVSVYVNATVLGNGTGQVTLGAEDSDNCQSTWSYVPSMENFTNAPFSVHASTAEMTIGGQLTIVNLDSNLTFIPWPAFTVPISVRDALVNGTGAILNETVGEYTIDCDATKAPLITLNIGGVGNSTASTKKLVLSGADYIRYSKSQGVCYLGVNYYYVDLGSQWYLGSQVLNNHCISFNYIERTVGFADSKTPKTDVATCQKNCDV